MSKNSKDLFLRTQRLIAARLSDPDRGRFEENCFVHEVLDPADLELEAALATTAYMNYRYKTPFQRTEEFALQYQKWYEIKQKKRRGRAGRKAHKSALSMYPNSQITMFWRARQHADALGMPYDRYIIAVMDRANELGTTELPAPNQLYADDMVRHAAKELDVLCKARVVHLLPRDCDPRFFAENYVGDPVQIAALDAIEFEVRALGMNSQAPRLSRYMREQRLISEPEARRRLGDVLVDAALSERLLNPVRSLEPLPDGAHVVPGCFGHHSSSPASMCQDCPLAGACAEHVAKVETTLIQRHGTVNVKAMRVRERNRVRKQRERDRKRLGKTMTLQEQERLLRETGNPKLKATRLKAKERRDGNKARNTPKEGGVATGPQPEG